jgi:hypothetical protein
MTRKREKSVLERYQEEIEMKRRNRLSEVFDGEREDRARSKQMREWIDKDLADFDIAVVRSNVLCTNRLCRIEFVMSGPKEAEKLYLLSDKETYREYGKHIDARYQDEDRGKVVVTVFLAVKGVPIEDLYGTI